MTFTKTALLGHQVLVQGTDNLGQTGSVVLDGTQYDHLLLEGRRNEAAEAFDAALDQFLAPIQEAVEAFHEASEHPKMDPLQYVVLREGVEASEGQREVLIELNEDSVVLRAIDEGQFDRLVWVDGRLVVTAASVAVHSTPKQEGATAE